MRTSRGRQVLAEAIEPRLLLSTYTVNTLSDATDPGPGLLTLRQAVVDANGNPGADTIAFNPTVFAPSSLHTITLTQGEITFTDASGSTTVTGPGSGVLAVSGGGASRIFQMNSGISVAMSGLEITDGNQSVADSNGNSYGGAIYNAGQLTLTTSVISGNSVTASASIDYGPNTNDNAGFGFGGAVYSTGSLTITGSTLSDNSVTNTASLVFQGLSGGNGGAFGGAIYTTAPLTLNSDTISNNIAQGTDDFQTVDLGQAGAPAIGGGVYAAGTLTVIASTISGNTATGGAAQASYSPGPSGYASGGGLFAAGNLNVSGSTLTKNSATAGTSGLASDGAGSGRGGGVYGGADVTLTNSTISSNSASIGIYGGDDSSDRGDFPGGQYAGGGAFSGGGGVYAAHTAELTLDTINDNSVIGSALSHSASGASAGGGGVYAGGLITVSQSSISGNTVSCVQPIFGQPGGNSVGGGIDAPAGGSVYSSTVANNSVTGGHGYYDFGGNYNSGSGGTGSGGGVYANSKIAVLTITNSTIADNRAIGGTGGSRAINLQNGPSDGGNAQAGGIFAPDLDLFDSTITGNSTSAGNGGQYIDNLGHVLYSASPGTASDGGILAGAGSQIDNSILSGNTAGGAFNDIGSAVNPSSASNLIGVGGGLVNGNQVGINNPQLTSLGNNGGPTETILPLGQSPAVDSGNNSLIPAGITTDQRGLPRIVGKAVDIGATELESDISGTVFNDVNGNGKPDPGESGIAGVTVFIDLNNAGVFEAGDPQTTTDSSGNYTFTGLGRGTYIIRQMVPGNDKQTFPSNGLGNHVPVAAGISDIDIDFGDNSAVLGSISGTEFLDENGDGIQDNGEPGFSNGVVYIDTNNNGIEDPSEPSATTNMSGDYIFTGLPAGTYIVRQVIALGDKQTFPANGFGNHVTLAAGQILTNVNFGQVESGSITGTVFADANGNGKQDSGELGIAGVTVYIDATNAGVFKTGDLETTTNASGNYSFTGLAAGTYIVRQILPGGDKQDYPTLGYGNHVTLASGQAVTNANFGDQSSALASISGTVFDDSNGNGIQDPGELGISGVVLYIDLDNAGDFQAGDPPTTTNSSGVYSFTGLAAGTYIVRQVLPSGDKQTFPTKGYGNHVTVAAGQAATGASFGDKA